MKNKTFIATIFIVASLLLTISCNTEKRALKKENSAIDLILSSRAKMAKILPSILDVFPCLNDSIKSIDTTQKIVKGKSDTITIGIPFLVNNFNGIDTIIKGVKIKIDSLGGIKIKVPTCTQDTVFVPKPYPVVDKRLLKNCEDTLTYRNSELEQFKLKLKDSEVKLSDTKTELSEMSKWKIYFFILIGIIIICIFLYIFIKSKI